MTVPPEYRGARVEATRPWMWKSGRVRIVRSVGTRA